jgi:hypothetical protein
MLPQLITQAFGLGYHIAALPAAILKAQPAQACYPTGANEATTQWP